MKIKALGDCCKRATQNYERLKKVVQQNGCTCEVVHVSDPAEIAALGCLATPGIAVGNKVVVSGRLLSEKQMKALLDKHGCQTDTSSCCQDTVSSSKNKDGHDCHCGDNGCDDRG